MTMIADHFHDELCFKKYRDYIKCVVTLAEIQNVKEASHHLTLMGNCQIFYSYAFGFVLLLCPNSKMRGECFTS